MKFWMAMAVMFFGYGGIGLFIWRIHRQDKKEKDAIYDRIRSRMRTYRLNEARTAYELEKSEEEDAECT